MRRSKVIHYPSQDGAYAVKVKNGAGWRHFDTARFHISVGQPYHEGEKFRATMNWAKHRFKNIIICVNDTLQRHNFQFDGLDEGQAFSRASQNGDQWIKRNQPALNTLPQCELHRWEDWRSLSGYEAEHARITTLFRSHHSIKQAISDDVMTFWHRKKHSLNLSEQHRLGDFQAHSTRYLIEECAAFSLMFQRNQAVDIYPGSTLLPCRLFKGEAALGEESFTRIDFLRNKRPIQPPMNSHLINTARVLVNS